MSEDKTIERFFALYLLSNVSILKIDRRISGGYWAR